MFSGDPGVKRAIEASAPLLLVAAGTFLVFIFFNWLFLEQKNYGLIGERFFYANGVWFYAIASVLLTCIVFFAQRQDPLMAFAAVIGSTAFFIVHGFKQNAEQAEQRMMKSGISDLSKLFYLEIIDATFSVDGVLGAFAFTLAVPLILLGNGIGAYVVRQVTVSNINRIKQYVFLKNGAMYSILFLGTIMLLDAFGMNLPEWISPIVTFLVIGYFFMKSKNALQNGSSSSQGKNA
jgi:hypothetical protein